MPEKKRTVEDIISSIADRRECFSALYSRCFEGTLLTRTLYKGGERVFLWVSRFAITDSAEEEAILNRLGFLAESEVTLPVIEYGVDEKGIAFFLTQWKEVTTVAQAAKAGGPPAELFASMLACLRTLHSGGMPFGDIGDESFFIDSLNRVMLCGIPAFGFSIPRGGNWPHYVPPDAEDEKRMPFAEDMYELGVYAHQVFTGTPFPKFDSRGKLEAYIEKELPPLLEANERLPDWAGYVLAATLRWVPDERTESGALVDKLRVRTGVGGQLASFGSGIASLAGSWFASLRPVFAVGGLLVVICGIAFAAFLWFSRQKMEEASQISLETLAKTRIPEARSSNGLTGLKERALIIEPTAVSTAAPTVEPTVEPIAEPAAEPTAEPIVAATNEPTFDAVPQITESPPEKEAYVFEATEIELPPVLGYFGLTE